MSSFTGAAEEGGEEARRRRKAEDFKEKFKKGEQIGDDVVLTEEIIRKLGVGPSSIKKVLETLVRNKVETWGLLRDLGSQNEDKKVIEAVGGEENEMSGRRLWNAVQDYNKLTEPYAKRLKRQTDLALLAHPRKLADVSAFFRQQLIEENSEEANTLSKRLKRSSTNREDFVLKLASDLSRDPYNVDEFVVRQEIENVIDQILSFFAGTPGKGARLLTGNQGCGKTTVRKIVVILLACSGHVVLYRAQGMQTIVFPKEVSVETKALLQPIFGEAIPDFDRNGERVFEFLPKHPIHQTIVGQLIRVVPFIWDIGDERDADVGTMHGDNKWLIISSPNAGKWQKFLTRSRSFYEYIVLPTWSWKQVKQVRRDPSLPLRTVLERFRRFGGGSLRHLLTIKGDPIKDQLQQLESVQLGILKLIAEGRFHRLPHCVEKNGSRVNLDLVYRFESTGIGSANSTSLRNYQVVPASKFVMRYLVVEYPFRQKMEASVLLETVSSCPQFGTFAGCICRALSHRRVSDMFVSDKQQIFSIYYLHDDGRRELFKNKEFRVCGAAHFDGLPEA